MSDLHIYGIEYLRLGKVIWYQQNASTQIARVPRIPTRLKTHRLLQVDIDRREQCCAANYEQVVNHVVPSCYS